ncbi:MAG: hypothetical protein R3C62_20315 [Chloroflexota bacterium]
MRWGGETAVFHHSFRCRSLAVSCQKRPLIPVWKRKVVGRNGRFLSFIPSFVVGHPSSETAVNPRLGA